MGGVPCVIFACAARPSRGLPMSRACTALRAMIAALQRKHHGEPVLRTAATNLDQVPGRAAFPQPRKKQQVTAHAPAHRVRTATIDWHNRGPISTKGLVRQVS